MLTLKKIKVHYSTKQERIATKQKGCIIMQTKDYERPTKLKQEESINQTTEQERLTSIKQEVLITKQQKKRGSQINQKDA